VAGFFPKPACPTFMTRLRQLLPAEVTKIFSCLWEIPRFYVRPGRSILHLGKTKQIMLGAYQSPLINAKRSNFGTIVRGF